MAFIGILLGSANGVVEDRLVIDDMVGGEHQHQRIISVAGGLEGCQGDGRGGVAPDRLKNNVVRQLVELTQLFGHQKAMFFVTDDHRFIDFRPESRVMVSCNIEFCPNRRRNCFG